jgi:hypothetical protein
LRRYAAFKKAPEQMAQRAKPAQHDSNQCPGERAIAILETREFARTVDELVERTLVAQNAVENVRRSPARGQACHFASGSRRVRRRFRPVRTFHCRRTIAKNSSLNPAEGYAKSGVMPTDQTPMPPGAAVDKAEDAGKPGGHPLPSAAERALAEAAARRAQAERGGTEPPKEVTGRGGLDPTRYGDWEVNGLISDF